MKKLAVLVVVSSFVAPAAPAAAQSPSDVAIQQVNLHAPDHFPSAGGWVAEGAHVVRSLNNGASEVLQIRLTPGEHYGIIAGCDQDCTDIDLEIQTASGEEIDSDYLADDYPVVEFSSTGSHRLLVSMPSCSVSPCFYAYRVFRFPGGGGGMSGYEARARAELAGNAAQFFPAAAGWQSAGEPVLGMLDEGVGDLLDLNLEGGYVYGIIAGCDQDCTDIDLVVSDASGNELDSDTAGDDYPVLEFSVPRSGRVTLEVIMYSCSADPCHYAYGVYRRK